jgi:hypothetical protein
MCDRPTDINKTAIFHFSSSYQRKRILTDNGEFPLFQQLQKEAHFIKEYVDQNVVGEAEAKGRKRHVDQMVFCNHFAPF